MKNKKPARRHHLEERTHSTEIAKAATLASSKNPTFFPQTKTGNLLTVRVTRLHPSPKLQVRGGTRQAPVRRGKCSGPGRGGRSRRNLAGSSESKASGPVGRGPLKQIGPLSGPAAQISSVFRSGVNR